MPSKMPKPTDDDLQRFRELVPDAPGVQCRPMFGQLGAFVNGNMFMGLFGPTLGFKLAPERVDAVLASGDAQPFGPIERPMRGWAGVALDAAIVDDWAAEALAHVAAMPPKAPKTR